jgi:outer membrane protein TolC
MSIFAPGDDFMMRGRWHWLLATPSVGLAIGCATLDAQFGSTAPQVRAQSAEPAVLKRRPPAAETPVVEIPHAPTNILSVTLESVLQLAESQNPSLAAARERVNQAYAEEELAAKSWLPDISVGAGYYRHEGGIQLQEGPLIKSSTGAAIAGADAAIKLDPKACAFAKLDAARKLKQQQGELRKLTTDVVLDAAGTYIDLLAAHSGLALARGLERDLNSLRDRAEKLAALERGARVEVVRIDGELSGQSQLMRKLEGQARNAAAKLAYLLGLDPCTELVPADRGLIAIQLANADVPACDLVAQALACGPGMKELEAILGLIQQGIADATGPSRFLPTLTAQALEGGFWAGRDNALDPANRFDLGVQARWNLTELCTADARRRVASSLHAQAQFTYCDLRGKLALGVQEARESIISGREQLTFAESQIQQAKSALDLSEVRLREAIPGSTFSEVLLSQRAVAAAQANHLLVLREYDKAQLRLMLLTGSCRQ